MAIETRPRVAIVILNWNGRNFLVDCMKSLEDIDYPNCEIIVVDNASTDDSVGEVRKLFPSTLIIANNENLGFSEGNNRGIRLALERGSDYILLLNNDTLLRNHSFLDVLVDYLEENRQAAAVGPLILYPDSDIIWSAGGKLHTVLGICSHVGKKKPVQNFLAREPYEVDYLPGCCILVGKEAFSRVGLLDSDYFLYFEDLDWCWRARRTGLKCMVTPIDAIYHTKSGTAGAAGSDSLSHTQAFYFGRNGILFARKNLRGVHKFCFQLGEFSFNLFYSVLHMKDFGSLASYLQGLVAGFADSRTGTS